MKTMNRKIMTFIKYFYAFYFFGLFLAIIASISKFFYSKEKIKIRIIELIKNLLFTPFYPLSFFSKQGRDKFTNFINKF